MPPLSRLATALLLAAPLFTTQAAEVSACTDFDTYVNAPWLAATELPADRGRYGSFDALRRDNDLRLGRALTALVADPALQNTPGLSRLAAFYRSAMDEAGVERNGLRALQPLLAEIDAATRPTLPALLGALAQRGLDLPQRPLVGTDFADATRHLVFLAGGGLGLTDRADYTGTEASSQKLREAYRVYARTLLQAAGTPADDEALDKLMAFEATLAAAHFTPAQRRDPQLANNRRIVAALAAEAPGLDWAAWLTAWGQGTRITEVNVNQPALARAFAQLVRDGELATWRTYLRVRLLDHLAPTLPAAFEQAHFAYRSGAIRGVQKPPSRSERAIAVIGGNNGVAPMGETLGELFVREAFSPRAQERALVMVEDIRAAMRARIQALPWMTAPTKTAALAKLDAMVAQIGAPAQWRNWDGLEIRADDYAGNAMRAERWWQARRLAELDKPVDRLRWNTSANTVNAFAAGGNRIVFPAGILQPPFFDEKADDASNYGGIGMVIGHEITHHFDDRGRQFDAVGNLRDWWQPADAAAYKARADQVAALYSSYEPVPGVRINGRQTLGENISDLAGIQIAYDGLQIALARQRAAGQPAPLVDGRTPAQRFFLSHATVWRGKYRTEAMIDQLRTGQHSPGRWRILGPLSNIPAFAQAFNCKPGDPMAAAQPIVIW